MDICCTEIRILFSQQPVRYQGAMNECQDKRVERLEQAIGGFTKMVGWKVGEGGRGRAPNGEGLALAVATGQ